VHPRKRSGKRIWQRRLQPTAIGVEGLPTLIWAVVELPREIGNIALALIHRVDGSTHCRSEHEWVEIRPRAELKRDTSAVWDECAVECGVVRSMTAASAGCNWR
jgi:hypothetical protein